MLDIQLTQYGKYLLAKGKLKPKYYTFSDDEILYDIDYVNSDDRTELKKTTSERIQKETQRLKISHVHEGVETRVLKLNGHQIKDFGSGWQARKVGRTEELPVGDLYGVDYLDESNMGDDERKLVRNILGHSTLGQQRAPTWEIESLKEGRIKDVNVSSSTTNIFFKRPEVNMEVDYKLTAKKFGATDDDTISMSQYMQQSGLEEDIYFTDNMVVSVDDDEIILSVVENNVDYEKENFEMELYEVDHVYTDVTVMPNGLSIPTGLKKQLNRLYFSNRVSNRSTEDTRYADYFFELLVDQGVGDLFGIDIFGTQRDKLKDLVKQAIENAENMKFDEADEIDFGMGDVPDPCDDE